MHIRWFVLLLGSLLLFGNYFAYDLPASLLKPLQTYLDSSDAIFNYYFGLFYSLYSLPNIVLPFYGGWLADKFGSAQLMIYLSLIVCSGQIVFSAGVQTKSYYLMLAGRLLFGIGSESLSVVQSQVTSRWFKNEELTLALAINLCVGRLGSVLNDVLSPFIALHVGTVPGAMWVGSLMCVGSMLCSIKLSSIETRSQPFYTIANTDADDSDLPQILLQEDQSVEPPSALLSAGRFWLIVCCIAVIYATLIPFNSIHSALLQYKWYFGDPETSARVMGIPDTISALLTPFLGLFVDYYGHRIKIIIICCLLTISCHLFFAFAPVGLPIGPIPALVALGIAYAMVLTLWSSIPLIVPPNLTATAFGISTSTLNFSLTVFPLIVAFLMTSDATFFSVELFFVSCGLVAAIVSCLLLRVDMKFYDSALERDCLTDRRNISPNREHIHMHVM